MGLRYLAHDEQELDLYYVFQGLSSDGNYWIDARFPVRLPPTAPTPDPMSEVYYANSATDADFIPSLTEIDAMMATVTTRAESGLSSAPQRPTTAAADPQFAYVRDGSIWLRNSQTGAETELVADTQAHDLAWSYDGRYLLYQDGEVASDFDLPTFDGIWTGSSNKGAISFLHASTARLFVLDLDEATPRPRLLAQTGCCAAWAPDRLAVAYYAPEQMTIHIVDSEGQELQKIIGATSGVQWLGPSGRMVWVAGPPQTLLMISEQMVVNSGAVTMATYPALLGVISAVMSVNAEKGWMEATPQKLQAISIEDGAARIISPVGEQALMDGDLALSPSGQVLAATRADMCAPGPCQPTTLLLTPEGEVLAEEMFGRHYSFTDDSHALAELWADGQIGIVNLESRAPLRWVSAPIRPAVHRACPLHLSHRLRLPLLPPLCPLMTRTKPVAGWTRRRR